MRLVLWYYLANLRCSIASVFDKLRLLVFSDSLKLCVGGRKGGRYMLDNRSPLQYSTDRPARLQGL